MKGGAERANCPEGLAPFRGRVGESRSETLSIGTRLALVKRVAVNPAKRGTFGHHVAGRRCRASRHSSPARGASNFKAAVPVLRPFSVQNPCLTRFTYCNLSPAGDSIVARRTTWSAGFGNTTTPSISVRKRRSDLPAPGNYIGPKLVTPVPRPWAWKDGSSSGVLDAF
jgi:hypothetical protein